MLRSGGWGEGMREGIDGFRFVINYRFGAVLFGGMRDPPPIWNLDLGLLSWGTLTSINRDS
jgi:hypothetical protein